MLVNLSWWQFLDVDDRLPIWAFFGCWCPTVKTETDISKLVPTHFVSNIRHQHRCNRLLDIDDGCWRWDVLVTSLKCLWQFWSFLSTTSPGYVNAGEACGRRNKIFCHQDLETVTNINSPTCRCHQKVEVSGKSDLDRNYQLTFN